MEKPLISITLPSLYPEACAAALRNIRSTTRGSYEVIVVSPFAPEDAILSNILWLREAQGQQQGCAFAHEDASRYARGEYIVPFADDHAFVDGWDEKVIAEYKARSCSTPNTFVLGLRGTHSAHIGTNFGIYYPYFPFMSCADMREVGFIGGAYRRGFGDSDLAMRVWDSGGRCEFTEGFYLYPTAADKRKEGEGGRPGGPYTEGDLKLFVERWAPKYGEGFDTSRIDGFNVDIRPYENPQFVVDNSIYYHHPKFMNLVHRMTT
jgi:hypothetical protein